MGGKGGGIVSETTDDEDEILDIVGAGGVSGSDSTGGNDGDGDSEITDDSAKWKRLLVY